MQFTNRLSFDNIGRLAADCYWSGRVWFDSVSKNRTSSIQRTLYKQCPIYALHVYVLIYICVCVYIWVCVRKRRCVCAEDSPPITPSLSHKTLPLSQPGMESILITYKHPAIMATGNKGSLYFSSSWPIVSLHFLIIFSVWRSLGCWLAKNLALDDLEVPRTLSWSKTCRDLSRPAG